MNSNGVISNSSIGDSDSAQSSVKETLKSSNATKSCRRSENMPKKPRNKNVVAFSDEVKHMTGLPEKTDVKQIAQSLGHLMAMMSRARMAKQPKISLTITPRRKSLSQESDVTAVDAQVEANKKKMKSSGKLMGGSNCTYMASSTKSTGSKTIPKTSSNIKLNRAKSFDSVTNKRQPIRQINCRLGGNSNMALDKQPGTVDPRTDQLVSEYFKSRLQNHRTHSNILKGSSTHTQLRSRATSTPAGPNSLLREQ